MLLRALTPFLESLFHFQFHILIVNAFSFSQNKSHINSSAHVTNANLFIQFNLLGKLHDPDRVSNCNSGVEVKATLACQLF